MAFELLQAHWLDERIVSSDDDLLVVNKPPGLVVHGGDPALGDDAVSRLGAYLGGDPYLGVHQRLDKDASGLMFFTRRRELNPVVAREMETHATERAYVAAVSDPGLPDQGSFSDRLAPPEKGRTRVVARGGKLAKARYRVLERGSGRALLELRPETGRTHQLRVQLAHRGAPIAGDVLYGGAPAWRLMLHATKLGLRSLDRQFALPVPEDFQSWVRGAATELESGAALLGRLRDAVCRRRPLLGQSDAYRLVNDLGDGMPGVVIDRYGDWAVLEVASARARDEQRALAAALVAMGARGVYLKVRRRGDVRKADPLELAPPEPLAGSAAPDPLLVHEGSLALNVRLGDGLSTGLFVDQRDNRARVLAMAGGKRVLNLFCYTGSFTVAAAIGGARHSTSVDLSGRALERTRANLENNGMAGAAHQLVKADALSWLAECRERFDLVVLDPPSFGTRGGGATFNVEKGYVGLVEASLRVLSSGGRLLAVTNHRKTSQNKLRRALHEAARRAGREAVKMADGSPGLDCPPGPRGPWPSKSVLSTFR